LSPAHHRNDTPSNAPWILWDGGIEWSGGFERNANAPNHIDAIGLVGWAKRSVPTIVLSAWARREERAFAHLLISFTESIH
jgi:hypothetical protein